jgi:hypothetical protein
MIIFNEHSGNMTITDLGRIAAKYYIRHASIEVFNKVFLHIFFFTIRSQSRTNCADRNSGLE